MKENNFLEDILEKPSSDNPYEIVVITAKRAKQIVARRDDDFRRELENMGILEFNPDQIINTDGWQSILAKTCEDMESPFACAKRELKEGALVYSYVKE